MIIMGKLSVCPWTSDLTVDKSIITRAIENPAFAVGRTTLRRDVCLVAVILIFQKLSQGTPR